MSDGPWPARARAIAVPAAAVARARAGEGPSLLEARVVRWQGHFEGDAQGYRDRSEVAEGRRADPLRRLAARLRRDGLLDERQARDLDEAVLAEIEDAVRFAESSPDPEPGEALTDLFAAEAGPCAR